jgi:CHRD domain/PEP-CTERM motif
MNKIISVLAMACATLLGSAPAWALEVVYVGTMTGAAAVPPNASTGTGSFTITFNTDLHTMRVQASFSGLAGTTTAARIHCCTGTPGTGTAGPATPSPSLAGFPLGVTAGSMDVTYDLTLPSSFTNPFVFANGGIANAAAALMAGAASGRAYFNIQTTSFGDGEIRAFLAPPAPVPEPASYALMLGGLAAVGAVARRRGLA